MELIVTKVHHILIKLLVAPCFEDELFSQLYRVAFSIFWKERSGCIKSKITTLMA